MQAHKRNAQRFHDLMFNQSKPRQAIDCFVGAEYIQHNPGVADGKAAFIEYFEGRAAEYHGNTTFWCRLKSIMKDQKPFNLLRRRLLGCALCGAFAAGFTLPGLAAGAGVPIRVWKSPTCGCCKDWITHLEANGFSVTSFDEGNSEARARLEMPVRYGSCHTAEVEGYAIEGHVPAREIHRLLDERPDAIGLAVPAMPRGSPGMDGPAYGGVVDPYDVLLIGVDGEARVYQSYR